MADSFLRTGIVAIGRNEGERLVRCLASLQATGCPVVYVDSGSTDGSVEAARDAGARVVLLDMARPFTAGRARAEGVAELASAYPDVEAVFFIDGDCELEPTFLPVAARYLTEHPEFAVACGRRRERFPDASPYNRIMDAEWNTPTGETLACGGDALFRVSAYLQAGGYDPGLVAHEEPELCGRIRANGWKIARLDVPMTIHDADVHALGQYLKRSIRGGHGYMQALLRMDRSVAARERDLIRRAIQWPVLFALALILAPIWIGSLAVFFVLLLFSLVRDGRRAPAGAGRFRFAAVNLLLKLAEFGGVLRWLRDRLTNRQSGALHYKEP